MFSIWEQVLRVLQDQRDQQVILDQQVLPYPFKVQEQVLFFFKTMTQLSTHQHPFAF